MRKKESNQVIVTTANDEKQVKTKHTGQVMFAKQETPSERDQLPNFGDATAQELFGMDARNKGRSEQKNNAQNPLLAEKIDATENKKNSADKLNINISENKLEQ